MTKKTSLLADRHIINNKVAVELGNYLRREEGLSQREAFLQAHKTIELLNMLNKGKVEFDFLKEDGTYRSALGSLHPSLLPQPVTPPKKTKEPVWPRNYFWYYDLDKCGWRTFKASLLIEVMDNTEVL